MNLIEEIKENVIRGHIDLNSKYPPDLAGKPGVKDLVQKAIDEMIPASKVLNESLITGMEMVGKKFSDGEYFVPDMLLSAQAMKSGMQIIEPLLKSEDSKKIGTVIIGTVKGDMHDIGKNLVRMMLEGGGFEVIDLGINTPPEKFIETAKKYPNAIIGMSALLTTTMENMRISIEALRANGLNNKVIIGGAAASQRFADEIHADGFTRDAAQSVQLVKRLMGLAA
ncbi:MAG: corrinoid protein [Ignavibacteria bacterium]|nr:corrinoid protein [Ignavibacteria bacterium]